MLLTDLSLCFSLDWGKMVPYLATQPDIFLNKTALR